MGIEEDMTPRGVFPVVSERAPEEARRPLEHYHEKFTHDRSADLDEDSWHALQELVGSGFVHCFDSERAAVDYMRGERPFSSKLALVKDEKRVSGSNSAALKAERTLLPKCWDIVRGVMALRKWVR